MAIHLTLEYPTPLPHFDCLVSSQAYLSSLSAPLIPSASPIMLNLPRLSWLQDSSKFNFESKNNSFKKKKYSIGSALFIQDRRHMQKMFVSDHDGLAAPE